VTDVLSVALTPVATAADVTAAVVALVASLVAGLLGALGSRAARQASEARHDGSAETLEKRLDRVVKLTRESSQLLEVTEVEIQARAENARQLKEQADAAQAVIQLTAEQREAVASVVRAEVTQESARSFRKSLVVNALFFIAGGLLSVAVVLFVHPL
jgi:hypothetical protein